jgi:hypothetical protein
MPNSNGLTSILQELKTQAANLPEDVSRQMILAAVLASRQELAGVRQRLRWVTQLVVASVGLAAFSVLLNIALYGDVGWAQNLIGIFR